MRSSDHGATCALAIVLALAGATISTSGAAKDYSNLYDLVGMRASSAEGELDDRGYRYQNGYDGEKSKHAYWWNGKHDRCVEVVTRNGRIRSIDDATDKDCGKKSGSGTGTAVAAVAGVALIAAIAAAASHKSGDKKTTDAASGTPGGAITVSDLNGWRASTADTELRNRGFANVDAFQSGNTSYTIWYRKESAQCVQMTTADGKASDVRDIGTHAKCK